MTKIVTRAPITDTPVDRKLHADTAEEFLKLLSPMTRDSTDKIRDWIFRGIGNAARYKLIPSSLRIKPVPKPYSGELTNNPRTHSKQVDLEWGLLWDFFRVADRQGLLIPEDGQMYRSPWASERINEGLWLARYGKGPWPFDQIMSLAALAQHHGVPTRLMDWSSDAFIAAYFAAASAVGRPRERGDNGKKLLAVWCLNWRYVWKRWPGTKANDLQILLVMAPRATNQNLHAQGGVFTVHIVKPGKATAPIDRRPLDEVIENTAESQMGIPYPVMRRVTLPVSEAGKLLRILASHNIHAASIYPGFRGVVHHLSEWRMWDAPPPDDEFPIP